MTPTTELTAIGDQYVIPGAERIANPGCVGLRLAKSKFAGFYRINAVA